MGEKMWIILISLKLNTFSTIFIFLFFNRDIPLKFVYIVKILVII